MNNDLISRSALLADIQADVEEGGMGGMVAGALKRYVKRAPAVEAVPVRTGLWELKRHKLFGNSYDYVCSACGCDYALAEYNYCPHCGAKMEVDK